MTTIISGDNSPFAQFSLKSALKIFAVAASLFSAVPGIAATVVWNFNNVLFQGGPVTGTITADTTTSLVTAVNLTAADYGGTPEIFNLTSASPNFSSNSPNFIRIWSTTPNLSRSLSLVLSGVGTWGSNAATLAPKFPSNFRRSTGACCDYYLSGNLERVNAVPEPASWAMLIAGFGLTGAAIRRRRATAAVA